MHPPLALHQHVACHDLISALEQCHREHWFIKYFGKCNKIKLDLNRCLREERILRRSSNAVQAREAAEAKEARWKKLEEE